ncbi:CDP-alcohol phosphatidyltransferase-domain-containing protein [Catenaria anguillulae PL171]|uniref:CDP-alcohol phosphatidyltransferase-domain-containing protein n=1 Tax=Catenaria anguillulae PL171 TaxID=765915 RepID=A0A1Y2HCG3_9FUNG|nr:CDP-alcohol phosphatidyltransferase-domain-containing protein [Catenaria anguillulae PL171]
MAFKSSYIPAHLRPNLRKYKYAGADHSLVSKYILGPYWNHIINYVPLWMAPNLVTLIGFFFIVFNVILTLIFSPDLTTPLPRPLYFFFGIGIFIYQSLDAIDGKQARRTGQSGPLGEMFDHGCDALNTTVRAPFCSSIRALGLLLTARFLSMHSFLSSPVAPALGYGGSWWMLISMVSTLANFFLTTWEEYHTGVLYLGMMSGPVEGILVVVFVFFLTGWFAWQTAIPLTAGSVTLMHIALYFGLAVIVFNSVGSARNVLHAVKARGGDPAPALLGVFPFVFSVFLIWVWVLGDSQVILGSYLVPLALYVTFLFGHLVGQIITAHVTKGAYPFFCLNMAPAGVAAGNVLLEFFTGIRIISAAWDGVYMWLSVLFAVGVYAHFALDVIQTICDELDIWCLTIKHPLKDKAQ